MIEFSEIIGHEDIIQHFKRSIEMGKVSGLYHKWRRRQRKEDSDACHNQDSGV